MKRTTIRIFQWIFSIFCFTSVLAYGFHFGAILLFILGIAALPVYYVQSMWAKLLGRKPKFKPFIIAIAFFVAISILPQPSNASVASPAIETPSIQYSESLATSSNSISGILESSSSNPVSNVSESASSISESSDSNDSIKEIAVSSESSNAQPAIPQDKVNIPTNSTFSIRFIDVGQADSALVECDGKYMLIDGGNAADSNLIYSVLKNSNISHLDYIVGTHAHEDHIGGLPGALNYATVGTVYAPVTSYDSKAFNSFVKYTEQRGSSVTIPKAGENFTLGNASVTILGPVKSYADTNNTSIVLRIVYGDTSFLFTGDAERDAEQDILFAGYELGSTVLKVGHHGSDSSTTYPFLREILPEYAVISVGTGNSYGHPTENTLSRLRDADVKVYRTDMQGDIICTSDGKNVSFEVKKNAGIDTLDFSTSGGKYGQKPNSSSSQISSSSSAAPAQPVTPGRIYILNTSTHKFHYPTCHSAKKIADKNRDEFSGSRDELILSGYMPCGNCDP